MVYFARSVPIEGRLKLFTTFSISNRSKTTRKMATDRSFESGMGAGQGQGTGGNEYGVGTRSQDTASSEEGMGSGQIRDQATTSNQGNEFGLGNQARDVGSGSNEEGMGAGNAPQAQDDSAGYEYGMGSGRPADESGKKEGGGLLKKVENIFHKKN